MTRPANPDRIIEAFLDEGPSVLLEPAQAAIAATIRRTRQRDLRHPWRSVQIPGRLLILGPVGVLVLAVAIAVGGFVGQPSEEQGVPPTQSVSPTQAVPPTQSVSPVPSATEPLAGEREYWILYGTADDRVRLVRRDGSDDHELVLDVGAPVRGAAWAYDGSRIAFEANFGVASQIWSASADGSNAVALTPLDDQCTSDCQFAAEPAWSSDGTSIAYIRTTVDGGQFAGNELVALDLATQSSRTLLIDDQRILRSPSWEPVRSKRIVLAMETPGAEPGDVPLESRLVLVDAAADRPVAEAVPETSAEATDADWGAAGLITYVDNGLRDGRRFDPDRGSSLLIVDPDSGLGLEPILYPADGPVPVTPAWLTGGEVIFGLISADASGPVLREVSMGDQIELSATGDVTTVGLSPDSSDPR